MAGLSFVKRIQDRRSLREPVQLSSYASSRLRKFLKVAIVTWVMFMILLVYLLPMGYMVNTALMYEEQFRVGGSPNYAAKRVTYEYQGQVYQIYEVPTPNGTQRWALVNPHRGQSEFVDPDHPEAGLIQWIGEWRGLKEVYVFSPSLETFKSAWVKMKFPLLFTNTLFVTLVGEIGVLASSIAVAYGFSRFRIPHAKLLFSILIITIMIPESVTLIPTYAIFAIFLKWTGTWLPILVPLFFSNAVYVFLLRQNFRTIPREQDEAAMLEGATPLQILLSIILPQSMPTLITVALLHFFYAWNEIRQASLYLGFNSKLYTIAFGIQDYRLNHGPRFPNLLQATALLSIFVPVVLLFLAQRSFLQHVRITGIEK